jgi:hypothetical protein
MRILVAASLAAGLSLIPIAASAQTPDARWSPWMGCWDLLTQRAPAPTDAAPGRPAPQRRTVAPEGDRPHVCVEPRGAGVVLRTYLADRAVLEQAIVADGTTRPTSDASCRGTERAEWSRDGRRLFSRAELSCPGQPARTVSGLTLFGPDGTWIDTQAVTVGTRENVRVRLFRRQAGPPADAPDTRPMQVADVIEASRAVAPGALEAALIESRARFTLSGRTLEDLADAGVPGSVTDLMVAVSYPQAFTIERAMRDDRLASFDPFPYTESWGYGLPAAWGADPYFYSPYYFSPFGFSYLGLYPQMFGSGVSFVDGGGGGSGSASGRDIEPGRVIDGRGYTRVRPRDAAAGNDGGSSDGTASGTASTPRRGGTASPRGYTDSGSGGSSGGSTSSGSGSSSGGSSGNGGGSGRTAVPR